MINHNQLHRKLDTPFWFFTDQGDLARVRTTLAEVRQEYEGAHRIAKRLMTSDPSNTEWQRDLSLSYNKLGNVAAAQAYRDGLGIRKPLAASDPANAQWQIDLAVSCSKLRTYTGLSLDERCGFLLEGLKIQQDLHNSNRLAPNQNWIGWFEEQLKELDTAGPSVRQDVNTKISGMRKKKAAPRLKGRRKS